MNKQEFINRLKVDSGKETNCHEQLRWFNIQN